MGTKITYTFTVEPGDYVSDNDMPSYLTGVTMSVNEAISEVANDACPELIFSGVAWEFTTEGKGGQTQ